MAMKTDPEKHAPTGCIIQYHRPHDLPIHQSLRLAGTGWDLRPPCRDGETVLDCTRERVRTVDRPHRHSYENPDERSEEADLMLSDKRSKSR